MSIVFWYVAVAATLLACVVTISAYRDGMCRYCLRPQQSVYTLTTTDAAERRSVSLSVLACGRHQAIQTRDALALPDFGDDVGAAAAFVSSLPRRGRIGARPDKLAA